MLSASSLKVLLEEIESLGSLIRVGMDSGTLDLDAVLDAYQSCRTRVAKVLGRLSAEAVEGKDEALDEVRAVVEERMRKSYRGLVPDHLLEPLRYGRTHRLLFAYMVARLGRPTAASRLRVLTGDQVHTERRVRELRELGIQVSWSRQAGENHYTLSSREPALAEGAKAQAKLRVREDDTLSSEIKTSLVHRIDQS